MLRAHFIPTVLNTKSSKLTQYVSNLTLVDWFHWFSNLYWKIRFDAVLVPNWYIILTKPVHMRRRHIRNQPMMLLMFNCSVLPNK